MRKMLAGVVLGMAAGMVWGQAAKVTVEYQPRVENANFPELLYWFVTPETLQPERYKADVEHIARDTYFGFPFLTERNGASFLDSRAGHDAMAGIVREGHAAGLKIGATISLSEGDTLRTWPNDEQQAIVGEAEAVLDAQGRARVTPHVTLRLAKPQKTELLRVWCFRKVDAGEYDASTLRDVTAKAKGVVTAPGAIDVAVDLGPGFAGYTVFAMQETWFAALDLYSPAYKQWVQEAIDQFKDVPLDGTSLDEFGYTRIPMKPMEPWRGHFAGAGFEAAFEKATGEPLMKALFETRYAPAGHPEVRIKAIDTYWDFFRAGPLKVEQEFFDDSRAVFGKNNLAGIHNTFHNHLTNDEAWATGINWWTVPRQYGMSDEDLQLPMRMGLLVAHTGHVMYDQYYGPDIHKFLVKALNDARFDGRLHYHGYNDTGRWGTDLSKAPFLDAMNPVEAKIRLLNQFDPAAPQLPLLVVFGMPALLNWYPNEAARNGFDINGSLHIEEKTQALWDAGYRCAVVSSDLIDNGALRLDAEGRPVLHGHVFRALIYLDPEYAKELTLDFLERYTRGGGALMLEGTATRDFAGQPVGDRFARIAARARAASFSVEGVAKLGVEKSRLAGVGGELEDGSVILTDLPSLEGGQAKAFSVAVDGHTFSGSYVGVFALKAGRDGRIEKMACGQCSTVMRDGRAVVTLKQAADVVLHAGPDGGYRAVVVGPAGSNGVTVER
jgi:hypothetical protein